MAQIIEYTGTMDILRKPAPTIEGGPGGRSGRLSVIVPLNEMHDFLTFAAGGVETVDIGGGSTIERILPVSFPGDPEMLLMAYRAEAFGTPGGSGASFISGMFSHWRVDCDFQTLPFGTDGETAYYTLTRDTAESFETVPNVTLHFSDSSTVTGEFGFPVPAISLTLTTYLSTTSVGFAADNLVGKINVAAFDDYPVGTLRFVGIKSDFAQGSFSRTLTKSYGFQFRPIHWNKILRKDGVWDFATVGTTGVGRFLFGDLSQLKYL